MRILIMGSSLMMTLIALMGCDALLDTGDSGAGDSGAGDSSEIEETGGASNTDPRAGIEIDSDTNVLLWTANMSPCSGSHLDGLECDDGMTCYVGCGSNADGEGLHFTTDAGASWGAPMDESGDFFADFRVLNLSRDPTTNLLYVGGTKAGSYGVVSLDTTTGALGEVWMKGATTDYSFTVGAYARTSSGTEVAESLTGTGIVVRHDDADWLSTHTDHAGWLSGYGWWHTTGFSDHVQVLQMTVVDDKILGVGAQINHPPVVYLPPRGWDFGSVNLAGDPSYAENMWETVQLANGFGEYSGECWDVSGNADGLAVVCVNQDADKGMIYTIGSDWETTAYTADHWTATDASTIATAATELGHSTWNEGVCRGPNNQIVALGRDSQTDVGYVLRSADGGATWSDISADIASAYGGDFGPMTRCEYTDTHLVLGGSGILATAAIADLSY
jgi:hypothetical protein